MKWVSSSRWMLEITLLSVPLYIIALNSTDFYSDIQYHFPTKIRWGINFIFISTILLRIGILLCKISLNWLYPSTLNSFAIKSRGYSLISIVLFSICLYPDLYSNIMFYYYADMYLIRIIILPLPIILGLADLFIFKSIE